MKTRYRREMQFEIGFASLTTGLGYQDLKQMDHKFHLAHSMLTLWRSDGEERGAIEGVLRYADPV